MAALIGAFAFTNWQNSNETEVYSVATFTIGAMCWAVSLWRRQRETERAPRLLLLVIFLAGISIGNHLLALLAGPAIVGCLVAVLWLESAADPARRREVGTGRGSRRGLGAADRYRFGKHGPQRTRGDVAAGAAVFAAKGWRGRVRGGQLRHRGDRDHAVPLSLYPLGQHPVINEAAPAT